MTKTLFTPCNTRVTKYTRSGYNGKRIMCPHCYQSSTVYHFAWSSLTCQHCESNVDKYVWILPD